MTLLLNNCIPINNMKSLINQQQHIINSSLVFIYFKLATQTSWYVYICTSVYTYECKYVCMYLCMHLRIYICMHMSMHFLLRYICEHVCMHEYACACIRVYIHIRFSTRMRKYVYACSQAWFYGRGGGLSGVEVPPFYAKPPSFLAPNIRLTHI